MDLPTRQSAAVLLAAAALAALGCEKPQRLARVGVRCPVQRADGSTEELEFGVWYEARPGRWKAKTDLPVSLELFGEPVGWVRSDCLAAELPAGEPRVVALGGAEVFASADASERIGRLAESTAVRVLAPAGDLALIADARVTRGFVSANRLWVEPRTADEVALELHWLAEAGKRTHVAEALAELGKENLAEGAARELACRVSFGGLAEPDWLERLGTADCVERPTLPASAAGGLDVGRCPAAGEGGFSVIVRGESPTGTVWACVGPSGSATLYVADRTGRTTRLGEVVVTSPGACPESRPVSVWPVGLGACLEIVTTDENCTMATGERLERAFCLPPPAGESVPAVAEIWLAFRRIVRTGLVDEECGELRDPAVDPRPLQDSLCALERERFGPRASSAVVRDAYGYLLCVRGAHDERGTRDQAFRFDPGAIVELKGWPPVCDVDGI